MTPYEVWPTDLLRIFEKAGIPRRVPPAFAPGCVVADPSGHAPRIESPGAHLTYRLPLAELGQQEMPLQAVADGDVKTLHWFADQEYLGQAVAGESFFWKPGLGHFVIRAVDDQGRTASREVEIALIGPSAQAAR
jgi:penicillin-binding protein 1C